MRHVWSSLLFVACLAVVLIGHQARSAEVAFQEASRTHHVDGDLQAAIRKYEALIREYPTERRLTAQALLGLAECYETLGDPRARETLERVVREFSDVPDIVAKARTRLSRIPGRAVGMINRQVWTGPDVDVNGSVSEDGRYLSFVDWSSGNLAVRELASGTIRPVTNKGTWQESGDFAESSALSSDGKRVAYAWFDTKKMAYDLRILNVEAGSSPSPRILISNPEFKWYGPLAWAPDGQTLAVQISRTDRTAQLSLVNVSTDKATTLRSIDWSGTTRLSFSPDGAYLAYDVPPGGDRPGRDVFIIAIDGTSEIPVASHEGYDAVVGWGANGRSVLFTSDRAGSVGLWAQSMDRNRPLGAPSLIKPDIGHVVASLGITRGNELLYAVQSDATTVAVGHPNLELGTVEGPVHPFENYLASLNEPAWGADGTMVALSPRSMSTGRVPTIWLLSPTQQRPRQLPLALSPAREPQQAPDGSLTIRGTDLKGRQGIFSVDLQSGAMNPIVLSEPGSSIFNPLWTRDGRFLIYYRQDEHNTLVRFDAHSREQRSLVESSDSSHLRLGLALSPNGERIAYVEELTGSKESRLNTISIEGGVPQPLLTVPAHETPRCSRVGSGWPEHSCGNCGEWDSSNRSRPCRWRSPACPRTDVPHKKVQDEPRWEARHLRDGREQARDLAVAEL